MGRQKFTTGPLSYLSLSAVFLSAIGERSCLPVWIVEHDDKYNDAHTAHASTMSCRNN